MRYALLLLFLSACQTPAPGAESKGGVTALRTVDGFVPLSWDAQEGRLYAELPGEGAELLYTVSLPRGLGSNDVGLDRGQLSERKLLRVRRAGPRVQLVEPNLAWRSSSADVSVRRSADESFAESVVFAFDVEEAGDGWFLVDATEFVLRDAHRIAGRLSDAGQGTYSLDLERSAVLEESLAGFPDNSIVEVVLSFSGDDPGREVVATTPDPRSVSLRVRHGFLRLPEEPLPPRAFHPRSGYFPFSYTDLSAPIDAPMAVRFLTRHRLERLPSGEVEPIVYYVDRGAPEPVRTALLEGARYWEQAFAAAGFPDGYRAELLPEGADPHDLRYNVIQWVNRSTRGWSYGETVEDPRTGEILKGHVTLGALRVRQDVLLAEGLLSPYTGEGGDPRPIEMALARIRQLSAHEVGHTLGLAHNFAASTYGRASVMDYPAPLVTVGSDGEVDVSDAYRDGCGEWDEMAIRYGYAELDDEETGLAELRREMDERELVFLTDRDARGADRAHPLANLWDNGADPVEHLAVAYDVREAALARFSEAALAEGRALAELEEVLLPVYLHHRFQIEAAVRALGGVEYGYDVRGEPASPVEPVAEAKQRRALDLALRSLRADFLELPPGLASLVPPRPPGSPDGRERFARGAFRFDPLTAAAASMQITLDFLLDGGRAARLVDQASVDQNLPSFEEVLDRLLELVSGEEPAAFATPSGPPLLLELRYCLARDLMGLAANDRLPVRVREPANAALRRLEVELEPGSYLAGIVVRFREDPTALAEIPLVRIPPGSPIGCGQGL